jgi:hypothetical protein
MTARAELLATRLLQPKITQLMRLPAMPTIIHTGTNDNEMRRYGGAIQGTVIFLLVEQRVKEKMKL